MKGLNFDINANYELIFDTSMYIKFDKYLREDLELLILINARSKENIKYTMQLGKYV